MKKIVVVWFTRTFLLAVAAFLTTQIVPYSGFFPYKEKLPLYRLPAAISALANFDGLHYLSIAEEGYHQYEQAFFPLYPLLIRFLSPIFAGNGLLTGLLISNAAFLIGLIFFAQIKLKEDNATKSLWPVIFLVFFPTAFFMSAVYTEGLFFFLVSLSLLCLQKKRYLWAGIASALASAARLAGAFLIFPFIFSLWRQRESPKMILLSLTPSVGALTYMGYLWAAVGDPLAFLHAQSAFGANRSSNFVLLPRVYFRYLRIFLTADWNFQYFIALVEFIIFSLILFVCVLDFWKNLREKRYFRLSLTIFSLLIILSAASTGTFSSIPRYGLLSISIYFYLDEQRNAIFKRAVAALLAAVQIVLFALFIQGYFVA